MKHLFTTAAVITMALTASAYATDKTAPKAAAAPVAQHHVEKAEKPAKPEHKKKMCHKDAKGSQCHKKMMGEAAPVAPAHNDAPKMINGSTGRPTYRSH